MVRRSFVPAVVPLHGWLPLDTRVMAMFFYDLKMLPLMSSMAIICWWDISNCAMVSIG